MSYRSTMFWPSSESKGGMDFVLVLLSVQSKGAKIRNRYNQVPHLTQDTNGKIANSQLDMSNESNEVSPFPAGDHKAHKQTRTKAQQTQDRKNP